jgi:hypothetical protein
MSVKPTSRANCVVAVTAVASAAIGVIGCREAPVLELKLLASPGLDPNEDFKSLHVRITEASSSALVIEADTDGAAVGSGRGVLDLEALEVGAGYVVSVVAEVPAACRKLRAVGRSLPFSHREESYTVTLRIGCADEFAPLLEPLPEPRIGARVIALPDGDALVVGGSHVLMSAADGSWVSSFEPIATTVRYSAQTGRFSPGGVLVTPRSFPAVVRVPSGVAVIGGVGEGQNECLSAVEILGGSASFVAEPLDLPRCLPGATALEGQSGVLVVGGMLTSPAPGEGEAELYDASGLEHVGAAIRANAQHYEAITVPLAAAGTGFVVGAASVPGTSVEIFRKDCDGHPCFTLPDEEPAEGVNNAAATYVPCAKGGGAVYVTGGLVDEVTELDARDDVLCYLDRPEGGRLVNAGKLLAPRWAHTAVAVRGTHPRVLVMGGAPAYGATSYANGELFDVDPCTCGAAEAGEVVPTPPGAYLFFHGSDRLEDGSVFVAGGIRADELTLEHIPGATYAAVFIPDLE